MGLIAKRLALLGTVLAMLATLLGASSAAGAGTVGWTVRAVPDPTQFSPSDSAVCASEEKCDRYQLLVMNAGDVASSGTVTLTDKLPGGITTLSTPASGEDTGALSGEGEAVQWQCTPGAGNSTVTCTLEGSVPAGAYAPFLEIVVSAPSAGMSGSLRNEVSVAGGGASRTSTAEQETPIGLQPPQFGVSEFDMEADTVGGAPTTQAGSHPWTFTTSLGLPLTATIPGVEVGFVPAQNVKNIIVDLPPGFVGNPQSLPRCAMADLKRHSCPQASVVGSLAIRAGLFAPGVFRFTGWVPEFTPIFNLAPQGGYPAEFGVTLAGVAVYFYASVVHDSSGYRLRVVSAGLPTILEVTGAVVTFFGEPGQLNGSGSSAALLTNPTSCADGPGPSRLTVESWENPGHQASRETNAYPQMSGCESLRFEPSLSLAPSPAAEGGSTQADEPSGYSVDLKVPQTSDFSELATPQLRDATVRLPQGVAISPPAAQGLEGCQAQGPEGLNIGSGEVAGNGQDLGDPQATELGAGHQGGNGSPYDDDLYHAAPGHCPGASTLGSAEAFTPLLADGPGESAPLRGHIYLAAPRCGGAGQPGCTAASAQNGELFGIYLELAGAGAIVKLAGSVAADPATGQLTATFKENPQLPFSDLRLHFSGGPRAPLANPQACGAASTTSVLEPWSAPVTPNATSSSSFGVDWDGNGGACPAAMPFSPGFSAGTLTPSAGAFSPFTVTFARQDREGDLAGLTVRAPQGLLGLLKAVERCPEPQASQGACGPQSQVGTATVAAGAGPHPLWISGRVYLTGPYKGAPFGLSVVVPAEAGPFHLGDVVVRAAVSVDPLTTQITVVSDPLPQIVDGVPLRVRTVNVTIDRAGFTFNPTSCAQQQVGATITSAQGASAEVSSPFAVAGCAGLAFKPSFTVSTQAKTSKKSGASLDVKVGYPSGGQANIHSVAVTLPKQLPARLTTIQQACPQATFAANPASCPVGSAIGTAAARTPILANALTGPAYLVSHGGAAFPDLVVVLQGEGVTVDLVGGIDIKKGVTSSTFASVPDAPISSFELKLPQGPHSGLAAVVPAKSKGSLCGQSLAMPTTIAGQNGAQVKQRTKIVVTGCPKAKEKHKTRRKHAKRSRKR